MAAITLTVVAGPTAGATYSSSNGSKPIRVGRIKTGNALAIKDEFVSSKHLEISWRDGSFFALDQGSGNGTKLNDSQVRMMEDQQYKLHDGDKLHLGPDTIVQVQIQAPGAGAGAGEQQMTVEEKLTADAERLAASIQAAAAAAEQQIRQEWAQQRAVLQALVQT